MYAFDDRPDELDDQEEANYYQFQKNQELAYTGQKKRNSSKPVEENLGFKDERNFGLPDYYGEHFENPQPVEIKN